MTYGDELIIIVCLTAMHFVHLFVQYKQIRHMTAGFC